MKARKNIKNFTFTLSKLTTEEIIIIKNLIAYEREEYREMLKYKQIDSLFVLRKDRFYLLDEMVKEIDTKLGVELQ